MQRPVIGSWDRLVDYVGAALRHEKAEQFRLLFLDRKNALIADEVQQRGTVDQAPVYPREVVKRALELGASAGLMVHKRSEGRRVGKGCVSQCRSRGLPEPEKKN